MADAAGPGSLADAVGAAVDDAAPSQYVKLMSRAVWNQISGAPRHLCDAVPRDCVGSTAWRFHAIDAT
mgnify:CR=1 FL=1